MNNNQLNYLLLVVCVIVGLTFGEFQSESDEYNSARLRTRRQLDEEELAICMEYCMTHSGDVTEGTAFDHMVRGRKAYCEAECERIGIMNANQKALEKEKRRALRAKKRLPQ